MLIFENFFNILLLFFSEKFDFEIFEKTASDFSKNLQGNIKIFERKRHAIKFLARIFLNIFPTKMIDLSVLRGDN